MNGKFLISIFFTTDAGSENYRICSLQKFLCAFIFGIKIVDDKKCMFITVFF